MPGFGKHLFICGNYRAPGHPRGCCDPERSCFAEALRETTDRTRVKGAVRANQAECLDQCEHGLNVVVYPDGVWYGGVVLEDVDEIIESHIVGNVPAARLMLSESCINTPNCEHKPRGRAIGQYVTAQATQGERREGSPFQIEGVRLPYFLIGCGASL